MRRIFQLKQGLFLRIFFIIMSPAIVSCNYSTCNYPKEEYIKHGNARFTVISKSLIRMEYDPGRNFLDLPSTFAINRDAKYDDYTVEFTDELLIIKTEKMTLRFINDGQSFHEKNLKISLDGFDVWVPGKSTSQNLGGTISSLDGVRGPTELGAGLLSRDGWYLIDDSRTHILRDGWVKERPGIGLDWYFFGYGSDYKSALKGLTSISGAVPMPRKYVLGSWYSRYWPYNSSDYRSIVNEYHSRNFPLDIMVLDMDWHNPGWTGWTWNRELLPDAEDLLRWLHTNQIFVTLNSHPAGGVSPSEHMYVPFMHEIGQDPSNLQTVSFDAANKQYMDALFKHTHIPLERDGVDFWWLDWQQELYTRSLPTLSNLFWLNHYYFQHSKRNGLRGQSFGRWGGWGDHRHPIHFSGDASTSWDMLSFQVPFTTTAGNVGCFFWSHDVGGHTGERNEEAYARWVQFSSTTAAMRLHSTRSEELDRLPWKYAPNIEESIRRSFHLRSELFPYIYSSVWRSHFESIPLNRPMYIEHPQNENAYLYPGQYYFGDELIVAPITSKGIGNGKIASTVVWLPDQNSTWYNWFSGEAFRGGENYLVASHLFEFPLFVRGGVPIPTQFYKERMGSSQITDLVIRVYPGEEGKVGEFVLYEDDGVSEAYKYGERALTKITYVRRGDTHFINIGPTEGTFFGQPKERNVHIQLMNTKFVDTVDSQYDEGTFSNLFFAGKIDVSKSFEFKVVARIEEADKIASKAKSKRLAQLLPNDIGADFGLTYYMRNHESLKLDNEMLKGILNIFGCGVIKRPNTAYNYPANNYDLEFFNCDGEASSAEIEITDQNSSDENSIGKFRCTNRTCRYRVPLFNVGHSPYVGVGPKREVKVAYGFSPADAVVTSYLIETHPTYLSSWKMVGPFSYDPSREVAEQNHEPFQFPVNKNGQFTNSEGGISFWNHVPPLEYQKPVNVRSLYNFEYRMAYAYTTLESPVDQDIELQVWADDCIELLLDGKRILLGDRARSIAHGPYILPTHLSKGKHELLLKLTNLTGDWAFNIGLDSKARILEGGN